jgi:hypothetical protein
LVFLLFSFVFYRLLFFETNEESFSQENDAPGLRTEICLLVSESGPVNSDSLFYIKDIGSRIFAYSALDTGFNATDTIWHVWYHGSKEVKSVACNLDNASCVSFLSSDSLKTGDWSVDARQKDVLLHVKQFSVGSH